MRQGSDGQMSQEFPMSLALLSRSILEYIVKWMVYEHLRGKGAVELPIPNTRIECCIFLLPLTCPCFSSLCLSFTRILWSLPWLAPHSPHESIPYTFMALTTTPQGEPTRPRHPRSTEVVTHFHVIMQEDLQCVNIRLVGRTISNMDANEKLTCL